MKKIPYAKHYFSQDEINAVHQVLKNGWIARGPKIKEFEQEFSSTLGYKFSVSCTNGSAAIEIALRAAGVTAGDEVIVPTLTWASTATSVSMVGATPIFADIEEDSYCISPASISRLITSRTKAIIPVHFGGISANMEEIWKISELNNLKVIEDCAHAVGGCYQDGCPIGGSPKSFASTFSFHPAKNMTTAEGGMMVTSERSIYEKLSLIRSGGVRRLSDNGIKKAFYSLELVAGNFHMTDIQAAIGVIQLSRLSHFRSLRSLQVSKYNSVFSKLNFKLEHKHPLTSAFNLYIVKVPDEICRDDVFAMLNNDGIGAYYHYPLLHQSALYATNDVLHVAEQYQESALTLPLGPHLTEDDIEYISNKLITILEKHC